MNIRLTPVLLGLAALSLSLSAHPARAGITDALPPGFSVAPWSVPGVLNNGNLATVFMCTATTSLTVGVEVFQASGGPALAPASGINLTAGQTATFVTQPVAGLSPDIQMGIGASVQGSARIVSTSAKVACHAFVVEAGGGYIMSALPVIKKTTQKGD